MQKLVNPRKSDQNEGGRIHTCQGLEFDYVGVIIGPDLNGQLLIINIKEDKGTYDFNNDLTRMAVSIIKKAQKAGQIRNQSPAEQLYRASAYAFMGYETIWCIKKGSFDRLKHVRYSMENIYDVDESLRKGNLEETS